MTESQKIRKNFELKPRNPRLVLKIGGAALNDASILPRLAVEMAHLQSTGWSIIVVHGGGPTINRELELSGLEWSFVDGQRVTTPQMMSVVEKALCGIVNRQVVRGLREAGLNAVGFSGTDGGLLQCVRADEQLGEVGRIQNVDTSLIETQLAAGLGYIPVIAPIGTGFGKRIFNINADWAAAHLAAALKADRLAFVTDQEGILDSGGKPLARVDATDLEQLLTWGVVTGGMATKTRAIIHALDHGVKHVQVLKKFTEPDGMSGGTACIPRNASVIPEVPANMFGGAACLTK